MKDVGILIGVFAAGYMVFMGILYVTFRIFFPFTVEKSEARLNQRHATGTGRPVMKVSRDTVTVRSNTRLHKIKLAHG